MPIQTPLILEIRDGVFEQPQFDLGPLTAIVTPPIDEDFWCFRVKVSEHQAIVGFPKFSTIGIGFAIEKDDWNTNCPYKYEPEVILDHIACNQGDDSIPRERCLDAIQMIRHAAGQLQEA